jgi:hypothetical protein
MPPLKGGAVKSQVQVVLLELAENVYRDATAQVSAEASDLRDLKTLRARVKAEGLSFLTIALPAFAKAVERSLSDGRIDPTLFPRWGFRGAGPKFLQGLLGLIFDYETGALRNDEESRRITPIVVESVRTFALLFKKVEMPCSPAREREAVENFVVVETINKDFVPTRGQRDSFSAVADVLWSGMLRGFNHNMLAPRHGPGATAEQFSGNAKHTWRYWTERLEDVFPFLGNAYPLGAALEEGTDFEKVTFLPAELERPVRVVMVPKTLKSPRVIAVEPTHMQFVQQALRGWLYKRVEDWEPTKGHINFRDQSVNQALALASSRIGDLATMDLSDASDRVPCELALSMFDSAPELRALIEACRSTAAELPDGRVLRPLYKFASMGSALTFPVEAMYFFTIVVMAILGEMKRPCTWAGVLEASARVFVYGDDLIVPNEYAEAVIRSLQEYNCKVNMSKTFYSGNFRESCGMDAYDGFDVTPVYVRQVPPFNRKQVSSLISWVATAQQLYRKGYWSASSFMYSTVERVLGPLPELPDESAGLGRISFGPPLLSSSRRWNADLQRLEVKAWVAEKIDRSDSVDGFAALSKCLKYGSLEVQKEEFGSGANDLGWPHSLITVESDPHHLERSSVRGALTLKRRWVPAR